MAPDPVLVTDFDALMILEFHFLVLSNDVGTIFRSPIFVFFFAFGVAKIFFFSRLIMKKIRFRPMPVYFHQLATVPAFSKKFSVKLKIAIIFPNLLIFECINFFDFHFSSPFFSF